MFTAYKKPQPKKVVESPTRRRIKRSRNSAPKTNKKKQASDAERRTIYDDIVRWDERAYIINVIVARESNKGTKVTDFLLGNSEFLRPATEIHYLRTLIGTTSPIKGESLARNYYECFAAVGQTAESPRDVVNIFNYEAHKRIVRSATITALLLFLS